MKNKNKAYLGVKYDRKSNIFLPIHALFLDVNSSALYKTSFRAGMWLSQHDLQGS